MFQIKVLYLTLNTYIFCCIFFKLFLRTYSYRILLFIYFHLFYIDEIPTSVDYVRDVQGQFVASYNSSHCVIFDIETKSPITRLECSKVSIIIILINI